MLTVHDFTNPTWNKRKFETKKKIQPGHTSFRLDTSQTLIHALANIEQKGTLIKQNKLNIV